MGILNALGLMTRAEHDKAVLRIERERKQYLDQAKDALGRADGFEASLKIADGQLNAAVRERDAMKRDLVAADDKFKKAVTDLAAAQEEIARIKPLAEATERRRANDAKRVRPSRAKKAAADSVPAQTKGKAAAKKGAGK